MGQRTEEIRALGADVLAVAVTATFAQQAFAEQLGVDFPLLSDWEWGSVLPSVKGLSLLQGLVLLMYPVKNVPV